MQPEDPGAGGNPDFACQRGEETSQGSPAPKAEKEIASLAARLSTNRANLRILLELCNSGKLPGHGRRQNMLAAASGKAADIWRATMAGARKNRILGQFLTEAAVLTSLGGLIGVIVGIILAEVISRITSTLVAISVPASVLAVIFSMAIGIIFGLLPSYKAANLNPIDALRHE